MSERVRERDRERELISERERKAMRTAVAISTKRKYFDIANLITI